MEKAETYLLWRRSSEVVNAMLKDIEKLAEGMDDMRLRKSLRLGLCLVFSILSKVKMILF